MQKNVGSTDRALRAGAGLGLLSLVLLLEGSMRWLGFIGLVPLATAQLGYCPAYSFLGINACPTKTML